MGYEAIVRLLNNRCDMRAKNPDAAHVQEMSRETSKAHSFVVHTPK